MTNKTYRVTVEENNPVLKPDSRSEPPKFWTVAVWSNFAQAEGSAKLVADALRSIADQLDPRKPVMRNRIPLVGKHDQQAD